MQGHCPRCGSQVTVLLPSVTCSRCGQDLAPLLPADELADALYHLAAQQARQGNVATALSVLEQALTQVDRSDLRLLAALLYRRQGNYTAMRRHVAAIPLDDVLRSEAEWLIRKHQAQVRREREQARQQSARASSRSTGRLSRTKMAWLGVPLVLALLAGAAVLWPGFRGVPSDVPTLSEETSPPSVAQEPPAVGDMEEQETPAAGDPREEQAGRETPPPPAIQEASPTSFRTPVPPTATATPAPTATPWPKVVTAPEQPDTPTPSPPPGVQVLQLPSPLATPTTEAVASTELIEMIRIMVQEPVDLVTYLEAQGRPDLAALPVAAVLRDGQLIVRGVVPFTRQRMDLLELLAQYPGVDEVRAVDLVVRLPEIYVVQSDDTLWTIADRLYGDGSLWPLLVEANPELLSDSTQLAPGMELVVPPRP